MPPEGLAKIYPRVLRIEGDPIANDEGKILVGLTAREVELEAMDVRRFGSQLCVHTSAPKPSATVDLPVVEPVVRLIRLRIDDFIEFTGSEIDGAETGIGAANHPSPGRNPEDPTCSGIGQVVRCPVSTFNL